MKNLLSILLSISLVITHQANIFSSRLLAPWGISNISDELVQNINLLRKRKLNAHERSKMRLAVKMAIEKLKTAKSNNIIDNSLFNMVYEKLQLLLDNFSHEDRCYAYLVSGKLEIDSFKLRVSENKTEILDNLLTDNFFMSKGYELLSCYLLEQILPEPIEAEDLDLTSKIMGRNNPYVYVEYNIETYVRVQDMPLIDRNIRLIHNADQIDGAEMYEMRLRLKALIEKLFDKNSEVYHYVVSMLPTLEIREKPANSSNLSASSNGSFLKSTGKDVPNQIFLKKLITVGEVLDHEFGHFLGHILGLQDRYRLMGDFIATLNRGGQNVMEPVQYLPIVRKFLRFEISESDLKKIITYKWFSGIKLNYEEKSSFEDYEMGKLLAVFLLYAFNNDCKKIMKFIIGIKDEKLMKRISGLPGRIKYIDKIISIFIHFGGPFLIGYLTRSAFYGLLFFAGDFIFSLIYKNVFYHFVAEKKVDYCLELAYRRFIGRIQPRIIKKLDRQIMKAL